MRLDTGTGTAPEGTRNRLLAALAAVTLTAGLGSALPARADGLAAWQGAWTGTCRSIPVGGAAQEFATSLEIRPLADDGSRYSWKVTYGPVGGRDGQVRNYEIMAVDAGRGHYLIDEKNGLKLDAHMVANQIFLPFTIGNTLITAKYVRMNGGVVMELPSFGIQPNRETCLTSNPSTCTRSFSLTSLQLCFLRKSG